MISQWWCLCIAFASPPPFPNTFSERFSMTEGSTGVLYYDYPNRVQRLDHYNNTASRLNQCYFWFNSTDPCIEYFISNGDQVVYFPTTNSCCVESCASGCREGSVPLPKPNWLEECTFQNEQWISGKVVGGALFAGEVRRW